MSSACGEVVDIFTSFLIDSCKCRCNDNMHDRQNGHMKIAQVAPLFESVPPRLYGGTERVVSYLTEALVERGHQVTLFASGDSTTSANLTSFRDQAVRLDPVAQKSALAAHLSMLQ